MASLKSTAVPALGRGHRASLLGPLALSLTFLAIPILLFSAIPYSFWAGNDYQPLGLADALNLAYRLGDRHLYYARGMAGHPGVPFYVMNWLALALAGLPVASNSHDFFDAVIAKIDLYHQLTVWLAAAVGAGGVFLFTLPARNRAPIGIVALGLVIWLVSTPTTLQAFIFPSIDVFALIVNASFLIVLVGLAYDRDVTVNYAILSGLVGAFAYLNKLSYMYIPLALAVVGIANFIFRKPGWIRALLLSALFVGTFVSVVVTVGLTVIGRQAFVELLSFHQQVFQSSGLYGTGSQTWISASSMLNALKQAPLDKSYAIFIALVSGPVLGVGGLVLGFRRTEQIPTALIAIGTGAAATLSAVFVLKHYEAHYAAGVSAALPACVVGGYMLVDSWGVRVRRSAAVTAALLSMLAAFLVMPIVIASLVSAAEKTTLAQADAREIDAQIAGSDGRVVFSYRAPFSWYSEGFVVMFASIPRLAIEYPRIRPTKISSMTDAELDRKIAAYVIDKSYFPTMESIKAAANVALFGRKPATFEEGDQLIQLRTVFLLIKKQ